MRRSLKDLKGYTLQAIDGEKGKVKDFLFDDETWTIRYVEADLGNFFKENRVLIPQKYLESPLWDEKHFPVDLTIERIKNSPSVEFDLPVSRKHEAELAKHYQLNPYWPTNVAASGRESFLYPKNTFRVPRVAGNDESKEGGLRSFRETNGYYLNAIDDKFGHIDDLIIDDNLWEIVYLIADTKNYVPWSKKVVLPIESIEEIDFVKMEAKINLSKEAIKDAPEYDSSQVTDEDFDTIIFDFYGGKIIK